MKIDEIKISVGRTIQVARYEFLRVDLSAGAKIDADETLEKTVAELHTQVRRELGKMIDTETGRVSAKGDEDDLIW